MEWKNGFLPIMLAVITPVLFSCNAAEREKEISFIRMQGLESDCLASNCHSTSPLAIYPPTSGKHAEHLKALNQGTTACGNCHWNYENNPLHRNGRIEGYDHLVQRERPGHIVFFGGWSPISPNGMASAIYMEDTGRCDNISCHGGNGSVYWYGGSAGCTACHSQGSNIDPMTTNGSYSAGKHLKHVAEKGYSCELCHSGYKSLSTHMNGVYGKAETEPIVYFDITQSSAGWDDAITACNGISCHGDQDWYGSGAGLGCTVCHQPGNTFPDAPDPLATGAHTKHISDRNYDCAECHNGYESSGDHNNGTLDDPAIVSVMIAFDSTNNPGAAYIAATDTCTGVDCHGDNGIAWTNGPIADCNDCHSGANINPTVTNGTGTDGKHDTHFTVKGYPCTRCHSGYTALSTHGNGTYGRVETDVIVYFDGTQPSAGWTDGTTTCESVSCHGDANWYGTGSFACTDCHALGSGNSFPNPPDPLGSGAHTKHIQDRGYGCTECHENYDSAGTHNDSTLNDASTATLMIDFDTTNPSGGYTAATQTCTSVYCHGENNVVWTNGPMANCTDCHSGPSADAINPVVTNDLGASGKHVKHVTTQGYSCTLCHDAYSTQTTHGNGTYGTAESVTIVNFDTSQSSAGWTEATTTCDSISCHGDVDWYTTSSFGCTSCHILGSGNTYPSNPPDPLNTASHPKHVADKGYACTECHNNYDSVTEHTDGNLDTPATAASMINFASGGSYTAATHTCSGIACHGGNSVDWGTALSGCNDCHSGVAIDPTVTNNSGTAGKHDRHVNIEGYACTLCHDNYTSQSTHGNGLYGHLNESGVFVAFDTAAQPTASWSDPNCSGVYCHGDADWYGTSTFSNCTDCHVLTSGNSFPNPPDPLGSGAHTKHIQDRGYGCVECHENYDSQTEHNDGTLHTATTSALLIDFDTTNPSGGYTAATQTCTSVYCHGENNVVWTNGPMANCTDCHSGPSADAINPVVTNNLGASGKHVTHVQTKGYACTGCHKNYETQSTHGNGTYGAAESAVIVAFDTSWTPVASASWTDATTSCGNLTCHANVNWYTTAVFSCTDCHQLGSGNTFPAPPDPLLSGKHARHITDKGYDCVECHKNYNLDANHQNDTLDNPSTATAMIAFDTFNAGGGYTYATKTCNTVNCHGELSISWTDSITTCDGCHTGGTLNGSSIDPVTTNDSGSNGKHIKHVTEKGYVCTKCHDGHDSQTTHINGTYGVAETAEIVAFDATQPSAGWDDPTTTCSDVTCHGNVDWYTTTGFSCTSCHQAGNTWPDPPDPLLTGNHTKHISDMGYSCAECHANYSADAKHQNGTLDTPSTSANMVVFNTTLNPGSSYTAGTDTCNSLYCHGNFTGGNNTSPQWGISTVNCTTGKCHDDPYTNGAHNKHTNGYVNYACSTCHDQRGYGTAYHVNAIGDVNFNTAGLATRNGADGNSPSYASGTCSSIYCHSNGCTADRGTDGTYTWTGLPVNYGCTMTYGSPSWSGSISACASCHPGQGNMTPPYTITEPGPISSTADYPNTGSHAPNRGAHYSNSQNLQSPTTSWAQVQCFWCHETDDVNPSGNAKMQGTYGTSYHIDGQTHFDPRWHSNGGTMVNTMTYSYEGSAGHCGNGKTCW